MAGANKRAAITGHQREDVPRGGDVLGRALRIDGGPNGLRTIGRRNAGCHPFPRLDRHGKRRLVPAFVAALHQRQAKCLGPRPRQCQADQAAPVLGHEVDGSRIGPLAYDAQVTFIFPVLVIDKDEQFARRRIGNHILDRGKAGAAITFSFSHYCHFRQAVPHTGPAYRFPYSPSVPRPAFPAS